MMTEGLQERSIFPVFPLFAIVLIFCLCTVQRSLILLNTEPDTKKKSSP